MRKITLAVVAVLALSCVASFASISVNWFTFNSIKLQGGATDLPVGSIAQLIWSADNAIDAINPSDPLTPQGGEVLLWNFTTTDAGAIYNGSALYVEADYGFTGPANTNYFANGYVYTRVFNFLAADGTPTNNTWYGEGLVPLVGPVPSQHVSGTPPEPSLADITEGGNFTLNQQIAIPEPATWALGFLGLGVLLRRRLMRK
jgi:uncharacterized protein (TIGR03382 family)